MGCAMGTPSTVFGVALIDRDKANRMLVGLYGAGRAVQYIICLRSSGANFKKQLTHGLQDKSPHTKLKQKFRTKTKSKNGFWKVESEPENSQN